MSTPTTPNAGGFTRTEESTSLAISNCKVPADSICFSLRILFRSNMVRNPGRPKADTPVEDQFHAAPLPESIIELYSRKRESEYCCSVLFNVGDLQAAGIARVDYAACATLLALKAFIPAGVDQLYFCAEPNVHNHKLNFAFGYAPMPFCFPVALNWSIPHRLIPHVNVDSFGVGQLQETLRALSSPTFIAPYRADLFAAVSPSVIAQQYQYLLELPDDTDFDKRFKQIAQWRIANKLPFPPNAHLKPLVNAILKKGREKKMDDNWLSLFALGTPPLRLSSTWNAVNLSRMLRFYWHEIIKHPLPDAHKLFERDFPNVNLAMEILKNLASVAPPYPIPDQYSCDYAGLRNYYMDVQNAPNI